MKSDKKRAGRTPSSNSKAESYEEIGAFWDTHDLADFVSEVRPASFSVNIKRRRYLVAVEPRLLQQVRKIAASRGLTSESLVNLWLKEKLAG